MVNCLPVVPVKLPAVCMGVPAADRLGLRRRQRTFVHKSYLLRWVRLAAQHHARCVVLLCSMPCASQGSCKGSVKCRAPVRLAGHGQDFELWGSTGSRLQCPAGIADAALTIALQALQLKAWQFPSNPGLTASEVLTSPFFR